MTTVPEVAVGAVVVEDRKLLLVQRSAAPGAGLWAVPGGRVRPGESLREAVRRETREETGLVVEVGDPVWVGEVREPEYHYVIIDFAATVVGGELAAGDDAAAVEWVALAEAAAKPLVPTMHSLLENLR